MAARLKTRKIETLAIAFLRRVLAACCFWRQTVSNSPLALLASDRLGLRRRAALKNVP